MVDGLEREVGDRALVLRASIQGDAGHEIARRHGIQTVPGFLAWDRDGRLALKVDGAREVPLAELRRILIGGQL